MTFVRRFTFDPGDEVITEIEAVIILDLEPPSPIQGVGSGMVLAVGEFENGPFETPTQMLSGTQLRQQFGGLGYVYAGVPANNPCARARKSDDAVEFEYWNGNAIVQMNGKKFGRLTVCRVDTSVGAVEFARLASLKGGSKVAYSLLTGQHLNAEIDGVADVATFTGVAATVTGSGEDFTDLTAGMTVTLGYDDAADFVVTFLAADNTQGEAIARINQYAGFAFASASTTHLKLTGRRKGTAGEVRVVSGSAGCLTALGLSAADTAGTGNVGDIAAVTPEEINTVVSAAMTASVEILADGTLRLVNTATVDGTGTLEVLDTTTASDFGFPVGELADAATGNAGIIPAGTRVTDSTSTWVTMQDLVVTTTEPGTDGAYSAKIRPATDDGTATGAATAAVDTLTSPIELDAFAVTNPAAVTAALTEAQIDSKYEDAIDACLNLNSVAKLVNISCSARQSNAVRRKIRQNGLDASAGGSRGRICCVRPPLGTLPAVAMGTSEPGVGPYRNQRLIYCYPGMASKVTDIARRGTAGGAGFTANGIVDGGSDMWLASVMSQLPPEENPAQQTEFMGNALDIESSTNVQGFDMTTYIALKAAGICAPIMDEGQAGFQSGVTSVDPSVYPALAPIARRRMADFIQDSLANAGKKHSKKLNRSVRRTAIKSETRQFLLTLRSDLEPQRRRIAGFTVKDANTGAGIAAGIDRLVVQVRTLSSIDDLVFETTIGNTVIVQELAPGEIQ